ncbi:MAG: RICIN domain-containing protein, partial [Pseudomonadota bacterium]|nr:RICIN domain-containing protein [Pseudomonadota bacterium]
MKMHLIWRAACVICLGLYGDFARAIDNGVYTIQSAHSGKLIEVGGANTADGANVNQWPANNHNTQKWMITLQSDGYYSVINL